MVDSKEAYGEDYNYEEDPEVAAEREREMEAKLERELTNELEEDTIRYCTVLYCTILYCTANHQDDGRDSIRRRHWGLRCRERR